MNAVANRVVLGLGSADTVVRGGWEESWDHGEEKVGLQSDATFSSGGHKVAVGSVRADEIFLPVIWASGRYGLEQIPEPSSGLGL